MAKKVELPEPPVEAPEDRDVVGTQQAMKKLAQYINATDTEVRRLSQSETYLTSRVNFLSTSLAGAERQLLESREEVRRLTQREKELESQLREKTSLAERGDDNLRRRAEEAESKVAVYGQQAEELTEKAELGVNLSEAGRKIVDAIERLPTKMEDATIIRTVSPQIPLYGTYEWQAVSDARFEILRALGEPTEEMGG